MRLLEPNLDTLNSLEHLHLKASEKAEIAFVAQNCFACMRAILCLGDRLFFDARVATCDAILITISD